MQHLACLAMFFVLRRNGRVADDLPAVSVWHVVMRPQQATGEVVAVLARHGQQDAATWRDAGTRIAAVPLALAFPDQQAVGVCRAA